MENSDIIAVIGITITVNVALLAIFYSVIFKKARQIVVIAKEIENSKTIVNKIVQQQTTCLEYLFTKIQDVENLIERVAANSGKEQGELILRCRNILGKKNKYILKNIDELKIFGDNRDSRVSAFNRLVSSGDINTLELFNLIIKTENKLKNRRLYKKFRRRLKNRINNSITTN